MAIVTRRYKWNAANLAAIQNNGDPGSSLPTLGFVAHVDVMFNDAISDAAVVDAQMQLIGYVFDTASPTGTPLLDITDAMRMVERVGDPTAEAGRVLLYAKNVAGISEVFTRVSDGTITPFSQPSVLTWGVDSILAAADTRYLPPGRGSGGASLTDIYSVASPRVGRLRKLYVRHNSSVGNGNSVVYTILVNGVASALTATLASGAIGQAFNIVNSVIIAQGDRITMTATKALSIANGALDVQATVEFAQ